MANNFSKEERVAFEDLCMGFEDALVLSRNINVYRSEDQMMERANDIIWRPMPYIAQSFSGTDMTANFQDHTQLSVPATLGYARSSPWTMTAKQLRDALQEKRLGDAAKQKLASDINASVNAVAAAQGTLVYTSTTTASGFSDMANVEAIMNEQGVNQFDRYAALSTRDYNSMASDLASRETLRDKTLTAYEKAYVGTIASFETYKLDYSSQLAAATATNVTVNGANQYYTPLATSTAGTGETSNVDNRYQTLAITATGTLAAGDCFTIAGVYSVHHITKAATNQLKTFRVITGGGTGNIVISPPIISGGGGTDAELQYQNVSATPANGATITLINYDAAYQNIFWQKDALELLPGRNAVPTDAGAAVMTATTEQGITITMQKQYDINTMLTKYRLDVLYGVCCKQPEMCGIMLFSQTP